MYAKNCTTEDLQRAAGLKFDLDADVVGNRIRFTIKNFASGNMHQHKTPQIDGRFRRVGRNVCLHGHYVFFRRLFAINPDAVVESSYYGKIVHTNDTLDDNYHNMQGIIMLPILGVPLDDCCDCSEEYKGAMMEREQYRKFAAVLAS